jgi:hypothetical protein
MKKWFNHNKLSIAGAMAGAIAGFAYWKLVGCNSGTCMITSKPINSTIYGATIGALLLGSFNNNKPASSKNNDHDI